MGARGQQITIGTTPTLIFRMVDEDTYKANGYTQAANPNIFIAGSASDELPLLLMFTTADTVYLGGALVAPSGSSAGAKTTGLGSLAYNAHGGDSLYAVTASGSSTISLLAMRQDDVSAIFGLVGHAAAASANTNTAVTAAIDSRAADLLEVAVAVSNTVAVTITDSASNTWTGTTRITAGGAGVPDVQIFYCANPVTSATHTFTATTIAGNPSIAVQAKSGASTVPLDQQAGAAGTGTSHQPGSVTPTVNNEDIVAAGSLAATETLPATVDSGMIITDQVVETTNAWGLVMAYLFQPTAAAINPTFTLSTTSTGNTKIATFKP